MEDTIFHKFARGEMKPDNIRYEDNEFLAFDDIKPSAPVHVLIIPKKEIISIADLKEEDERLVARMVMLAKKLATDLNIDNGYKLIFNVGPAGGQVIPYLHLHLVGGWK